MKDFFKKAFNKNKNKTRHSIYNQYHKIIKILHNKIQNSIGSVILEFAICTPVLVVLLFYAVDLSRIQNLYSKTNLSGLITVNMIQNQQPPIQRNILHKIHIHAWRTLYPSNDMFLTNSKYPRNHKPVTVIYYVQGNSDSTVSCIWRAWIETNTYNVSTITYNTSTSADEPASSVRFLKNTTAASIHPSLNIAANEKKIIVETFIKRISNNTQYGSMNNKTALGLYIVDPPHIFKNGTTECMFHSVVVFTPKEGLFTTSPPPTS